MDALPLPSPRTSAPPRVESAFTAIRIEGGLFPAEFLQAVVGERVPGRAATDYGMLASRSLRDEIGRYWRDAEMLWQEYRRDRARTDRDAQRSGVERWLLRLLREVLGYADIAKAPPGTYVGERGFPITHRAHAGAVPLLLTVAARDLDRASPEFGDGGRRRAPHAAMQEYLNAEPTALWGVVSNGVRLRLLRDNPSLTRPAYVEADLERIFEEGLYPDFAALWLVAHASRLAPGEGGMAGCWLERWRAVGAETGQRALTQLRAGVTKALRDLGSGFVEHPANTALRAALDDGTLSADALHQQLLRLVYRLILLATAEERGLLHAPDAPAEARALYAQGYALARLRERSRRKRHHDGHADLWAGLTVTFRALARGAPPLGLPALGGLFEEDQCPALDGAVLSNRRLLEAIHALTFFTDRGTLQRVNYRDMDTEELGSVYESLLELHPVVQVATRPWTFAFVGDAAGGTVKGNERKLSGSYYTPSSLAQELRASALDPVIERAIRDNPDNPREALLRLRVLDPACGSGHFLLMAARRLAEAVARLDADGDLPDEAVRRHALREVIRRCIHGVDRNPLSVELCRTALWIEALEPGKPLSFLDARIKCGDSLIGVADLSVLKGGIPDEAFKELTGDDKAYCRDLKKRNKGERDNPTLALLPEVELPDDLAAAIAALSEAPEDTAEAVRVKRHALESLRNGSVAHDLRVACDLWCAVFFAPKAQRPELRGRDLVPTTDTVWRYLRAPSSVYGPLVGAVAETAARLRFFHWPLEFPDVFAAGGFDCVLGNPPWERIKLQEQEFFAARHQAIATAPNAAARRKLIEGLRGGDDADRALLRAFEHAKRDAEASSQFVRGCGRFPLTAVGDVNTYALFAEVFLRLPSPCGRAGLIVPTGIATDDSTKAFFDEVAGRGRLASLYDFENREGLFEEVHRSYKFALLTLGSSEASAHFVFFATRVEHLADRRRAFTLSAEDIRLINPNTRTCPVFRSSADAELTKRIYARVPVLIDETKGKAGNPWGVSFMAMLHMSNDSGLFRTAVQLAEAGAVRDGADWVLPSGARMVRLYEAKMMDQFDHRYADYTGRDTERGHRVLPELSDDEHRNPTRLSLPYYWVEQSEVDSRLAKWTNKRFLFGYGEATTASTYRTLVCTFFPRLGVGHKTILVNLNVGNDLFACFCANANAIVVDYMCRQKVSYLNLGQYVFKQLPFIETERYSTHLRTFVVQRVLELTYTAEDMRPWAEDLGFTGPPFGWDEGRRAHLRAELDAAYAHLYGLTRDELRYILDPTDLHGPDFPSETFRVLKEKEIRQHGEYRMARLVLAAWDRLTADGTFAGWGQHG